MQEPLVIFHSNCLDGFGSAYAAYVHFVLKQNINAIFVPAAHGDTPPDASGRTVYILDYAYKRAAMAQLCQQAERVIVLDHHISALEDLAGLDTEFPNLELHFDMNRSGAVIAWEYFNTDPVPLLIACVQDRDLWRYEIDISFDLNAALMAHPFTFAGWHQWASDEGALQTLVGEGKAINRYRQQMIEQHKRAAVMGEIAGFTVPIVNCPRAIVSELLGELAKGQPFAAGYTDKGTRRGWSLRSDENGEDVARIAALFGGGGHKRAAGFVSEVPLADSLLKPQ
jgi:oligoribonuclease NrnB/cAMP/cGMP phosphodiesterase (DHH superfamily)